MARILLYGMNFSPEPVGIGRYSGEIATFLAQAGHDVTVVTTPPHYPGWNVARPYRAWRWSREKKGAVEIIRCPIVVRRRMGGVWRLVAPLSFALSSLPVVVSAILVRRPDVVLCVEPTLFAAPAALAAARLVGARSVLHVQDLEIDAAFAVGHLRGRLFQRLAAGFERLLMRRFDRLVAISAAMRDRILAKGVRPERVALIRNWVDLGEIRPLGRPSLYRAELGLPAGEKVALYAGSIGSKQALDVVLDAAEALRNEPGPTFVIAGDGPAKDRLVLRYGALPNVRFLPIQPEERLCELLNLADIHVLPQHGGIADLVLPSKLGGMLASGKRLVVTADPGTELHDFLDGVATLVPAGDSAALAGALRNLLRAGPHDGAAVRQRAAGLSKEDCLRQFEQVVTSPAAVPVAAGRSVTHSTIAP